MLIEELIKYILKLFESDKTIVGVRCLQDGEFQKIADEMQITLDECKQIYRLSLAAYIWIETVHFSENVRIWHCS